MQEDDKFAANLRKKGPSITPSDVLIGRKFRSQAPWTLAQEELKKINIYKSPHDKVHTLMLLYFINSN